ncbi:MAG: O-antigen ligase family protein [Leptolyngbyaceae cyanobacterium]
MGKSLFAIPLIGIVGALVGMAIGAGITAEPLLAVGVVLLAIGAALFVYFLTNVEITLLGLLILRSALDPFSPLPALFGVGINVAAIIYIAYLLLTKQQVQTSRFWWFFLGWVTFQGLWIILLPLGGLGQGAEVLPLGIREWIRIFTWVSVYLLVMQLRGRIPPEKLTTLLFLSLIIPLMVASLQLVVPGALPSNLALTLGYRINGTLGHAATFSTFLLFFVNLTWWKSSHSPYQLRWLGLLLILAFFLVAAQSLTVLAMLFLMFSVLIIPRLNFQSLLAIVILMSVTLGLLLSTDAGQERLASVLETPLLNPEINWSRSVLLSWRDGNSFNWRVAQWTFLLDAWRSSPLLGHGIQTSSLLTVLENYAHNDYVRALVEQGIIGLISFLGLLGAQMTYLVRTMLSSPVGSAKRDLSFGLFAFLLITLVAMATENLWTHTTLYVYWWSLFALLDWDWQDEKISGAD